MYADVRSQMILILSFSFAGRLGTHGELKESFKVTTPNTTEGPKVAYIGRSHDFLYNSGGYKWKKIIESYTRTDLGGTGPRVF